MSSALISLLCLGACLVQRTWAPMGGHHKPSLLAWPSPVVPLGGHVTLRCQFPLPFATFKLFRREGTRGRELQRHRSNSFTIDPMSVAHAGFYACSVALCHSCEWSAHSNPLQIVVTGVLRRPSISAQPSPLVHAGVSVTLCCHSRLIFDTFILHREGGTQYSQQHREKFSGVHSQARFSMGPLTPARGGTYRCYGTLSHAPQEWSAPSDPVDVAVTGLGTPAHAGWLQGGATAGPPRPPSPWAPGPRPRKGPTRATALSTTPPMSGQPRVTQCTSLSQKPLKALAHHPASRAPQTKPIILKRTPTSGIFSLDSLRPSSPLAFSWPCLFASGVLPKSVLP
ncbi:putative killer cell immunoglobulin-like receptor-like protein KIR3DX1 isoform X5 [Manis javanica]|uniref:putative killer cell immunoglobulin-like receptor-like protein KIR3DX1 isoform X5 n=1 Tax=Manis javanica TaxID=9974 RepID=UPI003C6D4567